MLAAYILVFSRVHIHYGRVLELFETLTWTRKRTMVTNCDTLLLNLVQRRQIGLQCISVAEPLPNMPVLLDLSPSTGNFLKEQRGELFSSQK